MIGPRSRINLSITLAYAPYGIMWTFMPIQLRFLNASYVMISLVYFVPALLPPVWGMVLDRLRRGREIILVSTVAQAAGFTILPFLTTPIEYLIIVVVMGFFSASFIPVYASLATWASPRYGRAIGGFWIYALLGFGFATVTGGYIFEVYGAKTLFVLAAAYGYLGVFLTGLTPRDMFYSPMMNIVASSQKILRLLKDRRMSVLCLLSGLVIIGTSSFNSFFTVYLVQVLKGSRLMAGLAAAGTTSLGALAYRTIGPLNDSIGRRPIFLAGCLGYVAYFVALYIVKDPLIVAILWVIPIYPLIQSSAAVLASDYTSVSDRGKGLGLVEAAISVGGGIGPLAGGLIADLTGSLDSVVLFALLLAILSVALSRTLLKEDVTVGPSSRIERDLETV